MFRKPVSQLTEADIQLLVDGKEKESSVLEFKRELKGNDVEKKELSKDISAMANSEGGYLIVGIDEKDGKAESIVGTPKLIGRQPVEEWVESFLISNIRPRLTIKPKVVEIAFGPEKVLLVIHIPQSSRRPHMVTIDGRNAYYRRHNFQSTYADEHEVRAMFLESKNVEDDMRDFLSGRHLSDVNDPLFAMTPLATDLTRIWDEGLMRCKLPEGYEGKPRIIFYACPRYLEEIVDIASDDFRSWLDANQGISLFHLNNVDFLEYRKEISAESIRSVKDLNRSIDDSVYRYVEIFRNGYLEHGTGPEMMWSNEKPRLMLQLTYFTADFWLFVKFARALYEKIGYIDEVVFGVCLADVKGAMLHGFGPKNKGSKWAEPLDFFYSTLDKKPIAKQRSIKLERIVIASELSDERLEKLVKEISSRVSNAFGEKIAKCFDDDGNFNINGTGGFRNIR